MSAQPNDSTKTLSEPYFDVTPQPSEPPQAVTGEREADERAGQRWTDTVEDELTIKQTEAAGT